ncbi:unnamed protein product, partial [Sphagnum balticum]
ADLNHDGVNYLGKLRSNFVGTEFQVSIPAVDENDQCVTIRSSVPASAPMLSSQTFRRLSFRSSSSAPPVIPPLTPDDAQKAPAGSMATLVRRFSLRSLNTASNNTSSTTVTENTGESPRARRSSASQAVSSGDDILSRMKDKQFRELGYFINKPPRWNDQVGAYVLNFNGRVTMASVKNFQLVDPDELNEVILQTVTLQQSPEELEWETVMQLLGGLLFTTAVAVVTFMACAPEKAEELLKKGSTAARTFRGSKVATTVGDDAQDDAAAAAASWVSCSPQIYF